MKRLSAVLCSLLVAAAFVSVSMAADPSVPKAPPKTKQKTAPDVPHVKKDGGSTKAPAESDAKKEEEKKKQDSKKGKKVEKKEETKKKDDKK